MDLRPVNPQWIQKKLIQGLKNTNPKTPLAYCIKNKKTIRFGNKSDPFQKAEDKYKISSKLIKILIDLDWSFVIQTRYPSKLLEHESLLLSKKKLITIMPVMSPGLNWDWSILERERTDPPELRVRVARYFIKKGISVGFNGEPFIPGIHKLKNFRATIQLLKENKISSYNIYNLHFNPFVAKRLNSIGLDIEKIWYYNQDNQWKKILNKLLIIADKYGIRLGCPDFVNTGYKHIETAGTCCGIDVPNRTTFNTHVWKRMIQEGKDPNWVLKETWDGSGKYSLGETIVKSKTNHKEFYTLYDCRKVK